MDRTFRTGWLLVPLLLGVLSSLVLTGRAAAVSKPIAASLSAPALTVPSVTLPPVTVPSVTVPGTTITTPPISTPPVGAPSVTSPRVPTPGTPALPSWRAQFPGSSGSPVSPGAPGATPGTAAGAGSATGTQSSANGGSSASFSRRDVGRGAPSGSSSRRQARETRLLRKVVTRDHGCLAVLNAGQQRLLTLRAGLDGPPGYSAAAVARMIHVSVVREARLERGALTALRVQAHRGCPGYAVASTFTVFTGTQRAAMVAWLATGATPAGISLSPRRGTRQSVHRTLPSAGVTRAAGKTKPRSRRGGSSAPPSERASIGGSPVGGSSAMLPILVGVLAVLAAGLLLIPLQRRRVRVAAATGPAKAGTGSATPAAPHPSPAAVGPAVSPMSANAPAAEAGGLAGAAGAAAAAEQANRNQASSSTSGSDTGTTVPAPPPPAPPAPTPRATTGASAPPPPSAPRSPGSASRVPTSRAARARSLDGRRAAVLGTAGAGMMLRLVARAVSRRRRRRGG